MFDQLSRSSLVLSAIIISSVFSCIGGAPCTAAASRQDDQATDTPVEEPVADDSTVDESVEQPATSEQSHQLDMALHYILIAKPELVQSTLTALFDSGITDSQLANLIDTRGLRERVDRALSRGRGLADVGALVEELESRFLAGTRITSRNAHRIEEAVAELGGTMRQEMVARTRLVSSGAFATPALLATLADGRNPKLSRAARGVLIEIKRLAIAPLCAALPHLDPSTQRRVCEILTEIGYPSSQAVLLDLAANPSTTSDVRAAAQRAYEALGGTSTDASSQYAALARQYFDQAPALIPYPRDAENPVWHLDPLHGLVGVEIPTSLYCETMAMQCATRALTLDPSSELALAIYVASDLRRAITMRALDFDSSSEGPAADLMATQHSAAFLATASGSHIAQLALGYAIDASDVALIRACIEAVAANASPSALVTPTGGRAPMIECLLFADRRVRFEAAAVLANARPSQSFRQDVLVVPILTAMVHSVGTLGGVIATTEEDRQALAQRIGGLGVSAVTTGASMSELEATLKPGQTLDLVVLQGSHESVSEAIRAIRVSRSSATSPVVIMSSGSDAAVYAVEYESDARVSAFLASASDDQLARSIESAVGAAGGLSISDEDQQRFSQIAIDALRRIADSSSPAFEIRHAEAGLTVALGSASGATKSSIASVLALVPTATAQRSLADAALSASGEDQGMLFVAVATSARSFGNLLQQHQLDAIRAFIMDPTGGATDGVGQAFGALGLSNADVVRLIIPLQK